MQLSIVIPAFNEAKRLPATVATVAAWLAQHHPDSEIVLVDDGSSDDTRAVLAGLHEPRLTVLFAPENRGKGAAVRRGVLAARGERIVFVDADLAYGLDQLESLLSRLDAGADLAIGARDLLREENLASYAPVRRVATAVFNGLVTLILGLHARDTQCGFKAFQRAAARGIFSTVVTERFGFDVEVLFLAQRWGLRVDRVPVRMRTHAESSVRLVGDSANMLADLVRVRARARTGAYPELLPSA